MADPNKVQVDIGADGAPARKETEETKKSVVENLKEMAEGFKEVEASSEKAGGNVIDMLKRVRSEAQQGGGATKVLEQSVEKIGEAGTTAGVGIMGMLGPLAGGAAIGLAIGGARELWRWLRDVADESKRAAEELAGLNRQAERLGRLADDAASKDLDTQFGGAASAVKLQRQAAAAQEMLTRGQGRVASLQSEKEGLVGGIQSEVDLDMVRKRLSEIDKELDAAMNDPETGIRAAEALLKTLKDDLRATVANSDARLARKPLKMGKEGGDLYGDSRGGKEPAAKDDSSIWGANITRNAQEFQAGVRRAEQYRVDLARVAAQGYAEEARIEAEGDARLAALQRQYDAETVEANRALIATVMEQERDAINRKLALFRDGEAAKAAAQAEQAAATRSRDAARMQQPYLQAAQHIGSAFVQTFAAIGRGTMSAGQAMKSFIVATLQGLIQLGAQLMVAAEMAAIKGAVSAGASAADIPGVGWMMAIPVAASVLAGLVGLIASAEGGYNIPSGVNPLTQLHQQEMVLPANIANPLRSAIAGGTLGGGEGGDTFYASFTNVDSRGFKAMLRDNSKAVRDFMREERRSGRM